MRRARDARRDGPCQCACSLLPRVAFGRSSDQDVHLVIVGDDPIPAPRSSGCRGFAVARLRRYLPAPAESAVCRVSARDSETTQGSKRSQAVRAAYNVIIAYHLGERGAHADARAGAGCACSNAQWPWQWRRVRARALPRIGGRSVGRDAVDAEVDGGRVLCLRRVGHRVSWPPHLDDTWHTLTALFY